MLIAVLSYSARAPRLESCAARFHTSICQHMSIPAAARLLGLWVRIQPGTWMSVSRECCVLSGRGLCVSADHSSRGVLPSVMCLSVMMNPRQ
jgi:hypothetical protein